VAMIALIMATVVVIIGKAVGYEAKGSGTD
jgi:hypothetical protein